MGSSTIYPFSTTVAEEFAALTHKKTPLVEAIGSGSGIKLLCQKDRRSAPDIANASRRMKPSELAECHHQGVKNIVEIRIGYDGIVIAQNKFNTPFAITKEQLALALLAKVPKGNQLIPNPFCSIPVKRCGYWPMTRQINTSKAKAISLRAKIGQLSTNSKLETR